MYGVRVRTKNADGALAQDVFEFEADKPVRLVEATTGNVLSANATYASLRTDGNGFLNFSVFASGFATQITIRYAGIKIHKTLKFL
jgi:hypothetical protein